MDSERLYGVLTNAQWGRLAPLIETVRLWGKTQPHELRRMVRAIIWRHNNSAKWRSIPAELGPWWMTVHVTTDGFTCVFGTDCLNWPGSRPTIRR